MITVYKTLSKTCQASLINEPHNLYKNTNTNCQCQIETLKTLELDHTGDGLMENKLVYSYAHWATDNDR